MFSHINEKPGRFSFYGTFRDIAVNKLFVNIPGNRWYQDGIPGLGDGIRLLAVATDRQSRHGPQPRRRD